MMSKGILIKKDGQYLIQYTKDNGETGFLNIPRRIPKDDSWINQPIVFSRENGTVNSMELEYSTSTNENNVVLMDNIDPPFARAPYNFIPLNDEPLFKSESVSFDKYHSDRYSGYMGISVENLTPLFIRQISKSSDSYGYGRKFGIPGSSFRGLIRTICEVISFGRFGDFDDYRLYYRGSRNSMSSIKAGVLKYEDSVYKIYPCSYDYNNSNRLESQPANQINDNVSEIEFTTGEFGQGRSNKFVFSSIHNSPSYCISAKDKVYKDYINDKSRAEDTPNIFEKAKNKRFPIFYQLDEQGEIESIGFAKYHRIPYVKSIKQHLPKELHKSDKFSDADLVQGLFGDTFEDTMIASRLSFGDLMSDDAEPYDTPQLLKILASPKPTTFQHYLNPDSNGNAQNWNKDTNIRGFKMYWHRNTNKDGSIDMCWNEHWSEDKDEEINPETNKKYKTKSHTGRVKPIQPNANFSGKIWFQNLSEMELGLLCMALEPNFKVKNKHKKAHKIGLAKPLGLGSIAVKIKELKLFNTAQDGYFSRFAENESMYLDKDKDILKNNFDIECAIKLGMDGGSIWDTDRLEQLKAMMTWTGKEGESEWIQKTRYMEIERDKGKHGNRKGTNEYEKRPILPKPTTISNPQTKLSDFVNHQDQNT